MACLDNVIKLSRTECECFDPATGANEGQSEVYLDELEGINLKLLSGAENCEQGEIWDIMVKARENATLALKADLLGCMQSRTMPKKPNYSGIVGSVINNASLSLTTSKAGILVKPYPTVGGTMTIRRIGLIMNASVAIQIQVFDNDEYQDTPIAQYTINSVANSITYGTLTEPLVLPLWSKNVNCLEYYFVYTISGFQPRNNGITCVPCSGGATRVVSDNWMSIKGIKGDGTDYASFVTTGELNGLVLDADLSCEGSRVICSDEYPLDFTAGNGLQIAYAIRYKAGAILMDSILSSDEINRYTMMDREALYGKRAHYQKMYHDFIAYLCENTQYINNDCWICKPSNHISRGTILK